VIEIPEIRRPGPTAHLHSSLLADVLKPSIPQVSIERIASRVPPVECADFFRRFFVKALLAGNPLARGRPHVGNVDILFAVVIKVRPARAHSSPRVVDVGFACDRSERPITVVAVQVAAPKIVGHVKIWQAVGSVVAPGARETIAVVLSVQSCRICAL
jgi:hypothetical protein